MAENDLMIRCSKCGEMNKLPVVHCKRCGAKLDFDAAEQSMMKAGEPTAADRLRNGVKIGIIALLVVVILLAIWPGRVTRTTGEEIDAKRYRLKAELLLEALNRELPASQEFDEAEVNAYLRELVESQPEDGSAALADLAVRFFPGRAEVFVATERGPFTFTALYVARPRDGRLAVTGARAGHLPLPGILGRLYAQVSGGVLRQLRVESRLIRNADGILVGDGTVEVLVNTPE